MTTQHTASGFFRMPYELRLRIYEDLLITDGPINIADNGPEIKGRLEPQLLRTCRQIHDEGADVLYGSNTFEALLHTNGCMSRLLSKWLRKITDTNVVRLQRIKLTLLYPSYAGKGLSGLFYVETTLRLRKIPSWSYVARYQALGDRHSNKAPPKEIEIQLEPDSKVDQQLKSRFQTKAILRAPWYSQDISFIYCAISQIQPSPRNDVDIDKLPESVVAFFEWASQTWRNESRLSWL